jgi:hypothetical protein
VVDSIERQLMLYCDNEPAILYVHDNKKTKAAKHINIRFYDVKEKIQDQTISLEHINTKDECRSAYEGLTTQCVQRTLRWHGFKGKPMILDVKGLYKNLFLNRKVYCGHCV